MVKDNLKSRQTLEVIKMTNKMWFQLLFFSARARAHAHTHTHTHTHTLTHVNIHTPALDLGAEILPIFCIMRAL